MADPGRALQGRKVVLGVTGSIAAYKAVELARRMTQLGAEVQVIMTQAATRFVAPLTFRELTYREVLVDLFDPPAGQLMRHVHLAEEAEVLVIAPATANILAKMAAGIADDLLTCTFLATQAPVLVAPAMNRIMYLHPATQENLARLARWGVATVGPEWGPLATGIEGPGRMASVDAIIKQASEMAAGGRGLVPWPGKSDLAGVRVLVSAGPTREAVDPVRFLTNRSSGKMGFAVARAARDRGAQVVLVTGPVSLADPPGVEVVRVETAEEMRTALRDRFAACDVLVMAAAVADFRPVGYSPAKLKKGEHAGGLRLELEPTRDILSELATLRSQQVLVGFAAETEASLDRAREKLRAKGVDLLVLNDVTQPDAGFEVDTNRAILLGRSGEVEPLPLLRKEEVAHRLLDRVVALHGPTTPRGPAGDGGSQPARRG
ncbi:bifunctional phosphopantothenoylcysteine decarboxylase/phosphopantothenate--cysteine ligase CoaBC [Limnochorda pilosa]|uniref:Coenzyme A biosynthesis bifunctional protein CoaBC n=1 Tax=Limnochorda pilosa TaxID=1555112 RepID=A0A0K2SPT6_LIMPI|nr:bifunctional phosphopantothenoylcysteine decarboxylase/phosphopantothenate--cysteine ligase CoaBC [Limnochorda pilosa]BAS29017.1 phosphopantothenoylcysteine decarboxylase [Limnochorda pilosa]